MNGSLLLVRTFRCTVHDGCSPSSHPFVFWGYSKRGDDVRLLQPCLRQMPGLTLARLKQTFLDTPSEFPVVGLLYHFGGEDDRDQLRALQGAHDANRLYAGDTTLPGADAGMHANSWNYHYVVKSAFEMVGSSNQRMFESHNTTIFSEATSWAANRKMHLLTDEFATRPPEDFALILRGLDCSPVETELAEFADVLFRVAKYRYLDSQGNWHLLPADQAKQMRLKCKRGVVELMAQTLTVVWQERAALGRRNIILHQPPTTPFRETGEG